MFAQYDSRWNATRPDYSYTNGEQNKSQHYMNDFSVTVVIAGNTYMLRSGDLKSLCDIPAKDRDQLIDLLEALRTQREKSERWVQNTLAKNTVNHAAARNAVNANQSAPTERLGKGDVDAIMSRLIMEERQQRKPGLQRATIYKIAAAIIVIIVLLSVF